MIESHWIESSTASTQLSGNDRSYPVATQRPFWSGILGRDLKAFLCPNFKAAKCKPPLKTLLLYEFSLNSETSGM